MLKLQSMVEGMELEVHITGVLSVTNSAPAPTSPPPTSGGEGKVDTPLSTSPVPLASASGSKGLSPVPPRVDAAPFVPAQLSSVSCPNPASTGPEWSTLSSPPDTGDVSLLLKKICGNSSSSNVAATTPKETTMNDAHSSTRRSSDPAVVTMKSPPNNAELLLNKLGGGSSDAAGSKPPSTQSAGDLLLRQLGGGSRSTEPRGSLASVEESKEGMKESASTGDAPVLREAGEEEEYVQLVPLAPYIPLVELYTQLGANVRTVI